MAMKLMSNIIGIFLLASRVSLSHQVECERNVNLKYGKLNEISCDYPLSFVSVRWYRGGESTPIATIEGGSKSVTQGYDITVQGDLQINQVDISHQGIYIISVLDIDGSDDTKSIEVNVIADVAEKPFLERCDSTNEILCSNTGERDNVTLLLCSVHNIFPAVDFEWYHLEKAQNQRLYSFISRIVQNETTLLYSLHSALLYKPNTFTLAVFTCKPTGLAASGKALNSSILVTGHLPPKKTTTVVQHAERDSNIKLKCSENSPLFAIWKVIFSNGTERALQDMYPSFTGGYCTTGSRCFVDHKATLSLYNVQSCDEATYVCTYCDGEESSQIIVQLKVIAPIDTYKIVVEGCNESTQCKVSVPTLQGTFMVSLNGALPSTQMSCEVADESKSDVSVFSTWNSSVEHEMKGTIDTELTVHYEIRECVEQAHVVCHISDNDAHQNESTVSIFLFRGVTDCNGSNTGLVVGLVFAILMFIVAVSIVMYITLRKGKTKHLPLSPKNTGHDEVELQDETKKQRNENYQNEGHQEEKSPLLKEDLDTLFNSFCLQLEETKEVPEKEIKELLEHFKRKEEADQPFVELVHHIIKTEQDEKILYMVLRYVAKEILNDENDIQTFCQLVENLTETNKLSVGKLTKIFEHFIERDKVSSSDFECVKRRLVQSTSLNSASKIILLSESEELKEKPYPYKLQVIYETYKKNEHDKDSLMILLHEILEANVVNHQLLSFRSTTTKDIKLKSKEQTKSDEENVREIDETKVEDPKIISKDQAKSAEENAREINETEEDPEEPFKTKHSNEGQNITQDFTSTYIQGLLCSVLDGKVDFEECGKLLEAGMNSDKTEIPEFKDVYENSVKEKNKKDAKFWIRYITNLWSENMINEELKSSFVLKIVETYKLKQDNLKKTIEKLIGKEKRKEFLKPIQFDDGKIKTEMKEDNDRTENEPSERTQTLVT